MTMHQCNIQRLRFWCFFVMSVAHFLGLTGNAPTSCAQQRYGKSVSAADIKKPPGWRLAVIFVAFLHLSVFL
jgi:hypothetical protein